MPHEMTSPALSLYTSNSIVFFLFIILFIIMWWKCLQPHVELHLFHTSHTFELIGPKVHSPHSVQFTMNILSNEECLWWYCILHSIFFFYTSVVSQHAFCQKSITVTLTSHWLCQHLRRFGWLKNIFERAVR